MTALWAKVRKLAFLGLRKGKSRRALCKGVMWLYLYIYHTDYVKSETSGGRMPAGKREGYPSGPGQR